MMTPASYDKPPEQHATYGKTKFKVGDRVRARPSSHRVPAWIQKLPMNQSRGTVTTITRGKANIEYTVRLDNGEIFREQAAQLVRLI